MARITNTAAPDRGWPIPYWAALPVGGLLVGAIFLFGERGWAVNALVAVLGLVIAAEGGVLISNWRRCADEFAERAAITPSGEPSLLSWVDTWHVQWIFGLFFMGLGALVIVDAAKNV
jgi:hypothetical protein